jgi:hypothetical protein
MLITSDERGQDDVPTCTFFVANDSVNAYGLIKLAHSETHCSISSRIFACVDAGWMFLKTSASLANSNASSIVLNNVRTLSSRCNCFTKSYQRAKTKREVRALYHLTRQGQAPREHLRADSMLSWHAVAAEWWKLAQQIVEKKGAGYTSLTFGLTVSSTRLIISMARFQVSTVSITSLA